MSGRIEGKRVLVTQASDYMGPATEKLFAAEGAHVTTDTSDLTQPGRCEALVEASGEIDILVANLASPNFSGIATAELNDADWQTTFDMMVHPLHRLCRAVLPQMIERGEGYLMNTSSAAGLLTQLGAAGYAVTKAAAVSFAEWIKITYGDKGIGVSCLCPQAVRTAMTANGPGVAGVDGMMEADVVAKDVLNAIEEERFLVTPHDEVLEYVKRKGNDRDRWITGMQRLQKQYEDFLTPMEED